MAESTARRRANGEGYLKHDPKRDRWRGAVAWTDPDGTPRRRAFSGRRQADVRRRMDELRAELAEGRGPASGLSLADYLGGWLEAVGSGRHRERAVSPPAGGAGLQPAPLAASVATPRPQASRASRGSPRGRPCR